MCQQQHHTCPSAYHRFSWKWFSVMNFGSFNSSAFLSLCTVVLEPESDWFRFGCCCRVVLLFVWRIQYIFNLTHRLVARLTFLLSIDTSVFVRTIDSLSHSTYKYFDLNCAKSNVSTLPFAFTSKFHWNIISSFRLIYVRCCVLFVVVSFITEWDWDQEIKKEGVNIVSSTVIHRGGKKR